MKSKETGKVGKRGCKGVHIREQLPLVCSAQCPTYVYSLTLAHTHSHVACLWWHRRHIAAECNCIKVIRQQDKSGRGWWLLAADSWLLALPSKSKATFGAWRWCRSDVVKRKRCASNGSWKGTNKIRLGKYFVMSSTLRPGNCCSRHHHHRHVDDTPSVCQSVSSPSPPSQTPRATCRESKSFLPSSSMRLTPANVVTIIYALVMTDNKALKNTNRSRQLRPRVRTRVGPRSQTWTQTWSPSA